MIFFHIKSIFLWECNVIFINRCSILLSLTEDQIITFILISTFQIIRLQVVALKLIFYSITFCFYWAKLLLFINCICTFHQGSFISSHIRFRLQIFFLLRLVVFPFPLALLDLSCVSFWHYFHEATIFYWLVKSWLYHIYWPTFAMILVIILFLPLITNVIILFILSFSSPHKCLRIFLIFFFSFSYEISAFASSFL